MAVSVLVTTVGSASANAYCTRAFADQYHEDRPVASPAWSSFTADQKDAGILWATLLMDRLWYWYGYPVDAIQALLWPRGGILKRNGWEYVSLTEIPIEIQQATAEYARQLLASDRLADSDIETQGVTSMKAGSVELTFKDSVYAKAVPDAVFSLVPCEWGYPKGRVTGVRQLLRA